MAMAGLISSRNSKLRVLYSAFSFLSPLTLEGFCGFSPVHQGAPGRISRPALSFYFPLAANAERQSLPSSAPPAEVLLDLVLPV